MLNLILDRFGGEVRADMLKGVNVLADAVAVNIFTPLKDPILILNHPFAGDNGPQG